MRVGVIGLGSFGTLHATTLLGLAEAELVAVVARREASLAEFAPLAPDVPGWLDLGEAIAESDAEAWIVATSTASHVPLTRQLLEAGKPVLLEKPIAERVLDAEQLAPLVADDSANLMLGHILLFNSEFRQLLDELARGRTLRYIDAVRHRPFALMERYPGESPFDLLMTHDLYCLQAMVSRAEPVSFSAQTHQTSDGQTDLALGQLTWEDGCVASVTASFMTPAGMPDDGFDRMEVFGDGWAAHVSSNPRPITIYEDKVRWPMALELRADPGGSSGMLAEQLRCFARVVRGLESVPMGATYQDALQVQRWLEELKRVAGE
ncbi:MAG: Gfo/Idh/MocA family oxidoreductase [Lentisphaerae bacterium]|nr:Gfo/Idh/MocA family oxidoreductase [Lentisphaerota bacterium]MBT4821637.1 Gfo/Idh/MocA family oxidoreductase [Lentisphaerota bacterium]MBT5609041.1 Gfo/Idh/MocA family oxidoreductase [Lentisphaerota bacterium]MBT7055473.1 Gfo/Idh/MocA family oxidoreductase [Lentisphaerota bacterium]MBT7846052.1 Gfo/Idh/MocA family oxidoreductase [Lentisphaerota bacterium]